MNSVNQVVPGVKWFLLFDHLSSRNRLVISFASIGCAVIKPCGCHEVVTMNDHAWQRSVMTVKPSDLM